MKIKLVIFSSIIVIVATVYIFFFIFPILNNDFFIDTESIIVENSDTNDIKIITDRNTILMIVMGFRFYKLNQLVYTVGTSTYRITFIMPDYQHEMISCGLNYIETNHYLKDELYIYSTKVDPDIKALLYD